MTTDAHLPTVFLRCCPTGGKGNTVFAVVQFEYTTRDQAGASTYGTLPSPIAVLTLDQDQSTGALSLVKYHNVDTSSVHGLWITCGASLSPWGTHLSSEEYEPDAPFAAAPHRTLSFRRCVETCNATVVGIRLAADEPVLLECLDDARHRRRADVLRSCELAERPRPAEDEDRQRREPRRAEAGVGILAPHMAQGMNGRGMKTVGRLETST